MRGCPGAAVCYRRAIEIDPKFAEGHCALGTLLLRRGDFHAARKAIQTGHDLGSRQKDWSTPSAQLIHACERYLELDGRLPAVLKGEDPSAGTIERIPLAQLCRYKQLHASAVRFYTEAFAADAKMAHDLRAEFRYRATCSAAQAGCGEGEDAAAVPDKVRASLRKQALEWLRADLSGWARHREAGPPQARAQVQGMLWVWQLDPALAGVRDADRLAALPSAERAGWQKLWDDVAATLAKVSDTK